MGVDSNFGDQLQVFTMLEEDATLEKTANFVHDLR